MILYGASGHAKVIIEIAEMLNIKISGLLDDNPRITELLGYTVTGPDKFFISYTTDDCFIISIGNNFIRKKIVERNEYRYYQPLVHPRAELSKRAKCGEGSVIMGNAIINSDSTLGKHLIINTSASIDHDCRIDDYAHISPNATITGGVSIGEGSQIGAGAVILPEVKIGKWAIIGAGAVIIKDVPDNAVVVGNPGRIIK